MSMRFQSKTPALLVPLLAVMAFAGLSAMAHDLRGQRQHELARSTALDSKAAPAALKRPMLAQGQTLILASENKANLTDLRVGAQVDPEQIHVVTRPGLYGIGHVPAGCQYGVIDGYLVRFDSETSRILSIVRSVHEVLD